MAVVARHARNGDSLLRKEVVHLCVKCCRTHSSPNFWNDSQRLHGLAVRPGNPRRNGLQTLAEGEPREPDGVCFQQVEQRLRCFAIESHEVLVSVILEQLVSSLENVAVVLDQTFRAGVCLTNL